VTRIRGRTPDTAVGPSPSGGGSMLPITRVPLCTVDGCPAPSSPDWHHCWVCGKEEGDHAHVESRARAPGKKRDPANIVFLCRTHHHLVDQTLQAGHTVKRFPDGTLHYLYWTIAPHRNLCDRVIGEGGQRRASGDRKVVRATRAQTPHPLPPLSDHPQAPETPQDAIPDGSGVELVSYEPRTLVIEGPLSWERYESLCNTLGVMEEAVGFWIGDLILAGEREFGERCYQPWSDRGFGVERLKGYAWVASRIPPVARVTLSFSHHRAVAALPPIEQAMALSNALLEDWTVSELKAAVSPKAECAHSWLTVRRCSLCHQWVDA
jgi:hypothetical protein